MNFSIKLTILTICLYLSFSFSHKSNDLVHGNNTFFGSNVNTKNRTKVWIKKKKHAPHFMNYLYSNLKLKTRNFLFSILFFIGWREQERKSDKRFYKKFRVCTITWTKLIKASIYSTMKYNGFHWISFFFFFLSCMQLNL